jgi:protein-S-isoprenylcysteine O-methyltransferase Ste14
MTVETVHTLINIVVFIQVLGAVLTFTPVRDRKRGYGSLSLLAFAIVLVGARRSDLFQPALIPGIAGLLASLALFVWARIAIHGKFFSYIYSTDVPQFVCVNGPYRWIRHPFYASYLLTLVAVTVLFPNRVTVIGTIVAIAAFTFAARFEEGKFEGSPVAADYKAYMQRAGRFLPRLRPS